MKSESVFSRSVNSKPATQVGESLWYARRFQELAVYKKTRLLSREVFNVSKAFPREEAFSLADQLRRASRSIGGQLAEAWAKRRYPKHFLSKLTDADGEQLETQHWFTIAFDSGYISEEETRRLGQLCLEVGCMLGEMITKAEHFCRSEGDHLAEESAAYNTQIDLAAITDLLIY